MSPMVACPDCGTQNRADADLCVQCWREMTAGAVAKIPVVAFAVTAPAPAGPPPPAPFGAPAQPAGPALPRRVVTARQAREPVKPREAEAGPVPYFAPVGSSASTSVSFPLPQSPSTTTTTTTTPFPLGKLVALAMLLALLGGGYYFFFGKSAGAYSPEDGAYSVELPEGWERSEEQEATWNDVDFVVQPADAPEQIAVAAGHSELPPGAGEGQVRAVLTMIQQFIPKVPGLTTGPIQESSIVSGEGVSAYEMTATVSAGLTPGAAKMRLVAIVHQPSSTLVFMVVVCTEANCPTAEPAFQTMAGTLEFSG